ncbi:MAG: replicative DNA helicase [Coriobacteriia bacterium]|nr:replicative DNA helicase [Coriobacteriia bacterium]
MNISFDTYGSETPPETAGSQRPNNREAEQAVLAAMILDSDIVEEALSQISARDFYRSAHRSIFSAISDLAEKRTPIDQISLADRLEARGELESAGGLNYIVTLANNSMAIYNWENHIEIVRRNSLMRDLMDASEQIKSLAGSSLDDTEEIVSEAERLLLSATEERIQTGFKRIDQLLIETSTLLDEQGRDQKHLVGVPSGFIDLDNALAGFRGGDLIILAARPSIGKSALAMNMAVNAAKDGYTIAFFSLEMPSEQITQRILAAEAGVNSHYMRTANLSVDQWSEINKAAGRLYACELYIDDNPSLNLIQLRAKARRQLRNVEPGKAMLIVDYLQLMQPSKTSQDRQRYVEVGDLTRGLKILAKELSVPIMVLSQLSRAVESRTDRTPQLSDLRESGSIEQDADVVLFIDRSMGRREAEQPNRPPLGTARLIIGKNRNGPTGDDIILTFDYATTRFMNHID